MKPLIIFITLFPFLLLSQRQRTDSLIRFVPIMKEDTNKVIAQNHLAWEYKDTDLDSAILIGEQALKLSKKLNYQLGIANSSRKLGVFHSRKGNATLALQFYFDALRINEAQNDKIGMFGTYQNLAIFYYQADPQKALDFYGKVLKIARELNDSNRICLSYGNLASLYYFTQKYDLALDYYKKALNLAIYLNDKHEIARETGNIALIYSVNGDYQKAIDFGKRSVQMFEENGDVLGSANTTFNIGSVYMKMKKYKEAEQYMQSALDRAQKIGALDYVVGFERGLYEVYELSGDTKNAFEHYKKYIVARDSVFNEAALKKQTQLEMNYEFEKKTAIEKAQRDIELNAQKQQKQAWMIVTACIVVAVIILVMALVYFKKLNRKINSINEDLKRQNIEIETKNEEINKQSVQIARYQSQMNPHFIFNAINGLQSMVLEEDKMSAIQQIQSLSKLLRLTLNNSENEYISIRDEMNYLENYVGFELQRFSKKFEFSFKVHNSLSDEQMIPTMLIQPVVENAIKHAGLNTMNGGVININIEPFEENDKLVRITITDNGKGISQDGSGAKPGHESKGIKITQKRIVMELKKHGMEINDYFSIKSPAQQGCGTEVSIIVPYYSNVNKTTLV